MLTYGCIGMLGIASVFDIQTKQIPRWIYVLFGTGAVVFRVLTGQLFQWTVLGGLLSGVLLLLLAHRFPKHIGEGDGWILLAVGIFEGIAVCIESFFVGVVCAAAVSLFLLLTRKGTLQTTLPFIPFLYAGYLLMVLAECSFV